MKKERRSKVVSILTFILIFLIIVIALFFTNKKKIAILISHLSHKNELKFVEQFLNDFKNNDLDNLRKYFLEERNIEILKILKHYDKDLQKRNYYIEVISSYLYDDEKKKSIKRSDWAGVQLSTKKNGKKLRWIDVFIVKRNGKYYIEHFQVSEHFPRPPNQY